MANRLARALLLHRALRVPVYREGRAKLRRHQARPQDLCLHLAPGCPPRAQRRELAAERSLDFRS